MTTPAPPTEVDVPTFATVHRDAPTVVDVRESDEFTAGHVPGAQHLPLAELPGALERIVGPDPVYLICASGNRSLKAARLLADAGRTAVSVSGGTRAWIRAGLPTEGN
ncbi:rhodanese-like domain-containing protein [Rhodococcus sp. HNM0569]|uniref:rhodanese-like domain-containing protein n=1 Tax=Rhodococcus sp. HNM0569 TaxID=2716340 RepID=UPI003211E628